MKQNEKQALWITIIWLILNLLSFFIWKEVGLFICNAIIIIILSWVVSIRMIKKMIKNKN